MKYTKTITAILTSVLCAAGAWAHDYSSGIDGGELFFRITDKDSRTAEVTYAGSIADSITSQISGTVDIPTVVTIDSIIYSVTAIGPKAFSGANGITAVVIPESIEKIGAFAFENCPALTEITFPNDQVELGAGCFFNDRAIKMVNLGKDWKSVDLQYFCWSDSLLSIDIPAGIQEISNLKTLKTLKTINVSDANQQYSSNDGNLYDKLGNELYAVPCGRTGSVRIPEGTTKVAPGALIDCYKIASIDLPSTLNYISFREFSHMPGLSEIIFRSEEVPVTGYTADTRQEAFVLQLDNPQAAISVPRKSKNTYTSRLVENPGQYCETLDDDAKAYRVRASQLPFKKNVKGVKNL